jgi:regulator of protease activity HflC (stomatin/prohibitin superfamily)
MTSVLPWAIAGFALLLLLSATVRIVPEYERGVIFRLGRVMAAKGPGLFFIFLSSTGWFGCHCAPSR